MRHDILRELRLRSLGLLLLNGPVAMSTSSWPSNLYIENHLQSFFAENGLGPFLMPGLASPLSTDGAENLVLYGEIAYHFMRLPATAAEKFRLWVLCEKYRAYAQDTFGVRAGQIGCVPREYFLSAHGWKRGISLHGSIKGFVFAGRANLPTKRVRLAIRLVEALREQAGEDFLFHICHAGTPLSVLDEVVRMSGSRPWMRIHEGLGPEWVEILGEHIFLSVSHYDYEDLGVAACESISRGQPVILSDWGGHSDFDADYALKLPTLSEWDVKSETSFAARHAKTVLRFLSEMKPPVIRPRPRAEPVALTYLAPVLARLDTTLADFGVRGIAPLVSQRAKYQTMRGYLESRR